MEDVDVGETVGLKRKLDDLGRVVIPIEFRKELNLKEKAEIQIFLTKNGIFLKV